MGVTRGYQPERLELTGSRYTVEQTGTDENMRPEYEATNEAGEVVFEATYEMYQANDSVSFVDADGAELFTVTAAGTLDIAGDYVLTDAHTEDDLLILDNDFSLGQDSWRIRDPEDRSLLAELSSRGGAVTLARKLLPFGGWLGHEYEITDSAGEAVGSAESGFAVFDEYEITIADTSSVPMVGIVAALAVIDGIQNS